MIVDLAVSLDAIVTTMRQVTPTDLILFENGDSRNRSGITLEKPSL